MSQSWQRVTTRLVKGENVWVAAGVREDGACFATTALSEIEAVARLNYWLEAPPKSKQQSFEEYASSIEYKEFSKACTNGKGEIPIIRCLQP